MAKSNVIKIIKFLEKSLTDGGLNISKIILFGSYAAKRATEESDIDIVIVSEDFRDKDIFERIRLLKDAEIATIRKFMVPLDIVTMTPEEFGSKMSLIADFAKKGEVVYAA